MNATSRIMIGWKATLLGLMTIGAGVLTALLVHRYPVGPRVPMWAIYGSCLAVVSLGLATVALSFTRRKVALVLYVSFLAGAIGIAATLVLARAIGKCTSAVSGISVASPELVCQGAYAAGIVGGAVLLCYFIVGFLGRQNSA